MSYHDFHGKTTEEAISEGLRKLGLTISDVTVEVLDEGAKGLFGLFGSKQASVRLTLNDPSDDAFSVLRSLSLDDYSASGEPPKAPAPPKAPKQPKPQAERPSPKEDDARPVQPKAPRAERERPKPTPKPRPRHESTGDAAPRTSLSSTFVPVPLVEGATPAVHDPATPAGCAQQFLLELTKRMHVDVIVDVQTDPEGNLFAQMLGDTLGILIGRRGETLDALQYLTSLQVNKGRDDYIRVTLDTENYRAKREDSLCRLAARMAQRAYKTGRKVSMEPMNPYERRILHASLQDHPHVVTHSEGEEPNRHVVITLKEGVVPPRRTPQPVREAVADAREDME